MKLRRDYIGTQARHFGGQLLGLPVIGIAGSRRSEPNILKQTCDQSVGTQAYLQFEDQVIVFEKLDEEQSLEHIESNVITEMLPRLYSQMRAS